MGSASTEPSSILSMLKVTVSPDLYLNAPSASVLPDWPDEVA